MPRSLVLFVASAVAATHVTAFNPDLIYKYCGVDFRGADISSVKETEPDVCPWHCVGVEGCTTATWTDYQGGTCWLKRWASDDGISVGAISYVLMENGDYTGAEQAVYRCESDKDIPGYDLYSVRAANIQTCSGLCGLSNQCWAAVWTDYQGGTCWLKSRANTYVSRPGAQLCLIFRKLRAGLAVCNKV